MEAVRCETLPRRGPAKTGLKVSSLSSTDEQPPSDSDGSHRASLSRQPRLLTPVRARPPALACAGDSLPVISLDAD
jgi:hypothetical protein